MTWGKIDCTSRLSVCTLCIPEASRHAVCRHSVKQFQGPVRARKLGPRMILSAPQLTASQAAMNGVRLWAQSSTWRAECRLAWRAPPPAPTSAAPAAPAASPPHTCTSTHQTLHILASGRISDHAVAKRLLQHMPKRPLTTRSMNDSMEHASCLLTKVLSVKSWAHHMQCQARRSLVKPREQGLYASGHVTL